MRLSRTVVYATQALLHLSRAKPGVPVPCSQLAQEGQLPERFLLQILRSLVTQGLLRSTRGVVGGYCLAKSPAEITLWDILEAFDNPLAVNGAVLKSLPLPVRDCMQDVLEVASDKARVELQRLTLAEMHERDRAAAGPPGFDGIRLPEPPSMSVDV